jgi:hypothetical protein
VKNQLIGCPWIPAVFLATTTFAYRYMSFQGFNNDHFLHVARAQQMLLGELPVRDYVESGMPLMEALSAAAQLVGGAGLFSEIVLTCATFALASLFMYVVAVRIGGSPWFAAAAVIVLGIAYPLSYSYPKVLPYAAAFLAAWYYFAQPTRLRLIVVAATIVVAFLFRHDHGLILGAGVTVALIAHRRDSHLWTEVGWFAATCVALVSPYLVWVQLYEGLPSYVQHARAFTQTEISKATWTAPSFFINRDLPLIERTHRHQGPVVHVRWAPDVDNASLAAHEAAHGLRRLDPIGPESWQYELSRWSAEDLRALVTDAAIADTDGIDRRVYRLTSSHVVDEIDTAYHPEVVFNARNAVAALYYLSWALPVAALLLLMSDTDIPRAIVPMTVLLIVVQLLMNRTMLRDPLATRVRDVVAPMAALLALLCGRFWRDRSARAVAIWRRTIAVATMLLAITAAALAGDLRAHIEDIQSGKLRAEYAVVKRRTSVATGGGGLIEYLSACSPERARFLPLTFAPELFFYTGHGFAGGHESLVPGYYTSAADTARILDRLSHEDVPFTIMDNETADRFRAGYPRLMQYVDSHFHEVAVFPVGEGKWRLILADSQRRSLHVFGDRKLPCFTAPRVINR